MDLVHGPWSTVPGAKDPTASFTPLEVLGVGTVVIILMLILIMILHMALTLFQDCRRRREEEARLLWMMEMGEQEQEEQEPNTSMSSYHFLLPETILMSRPPLPRPGPEEAAPSSWRLQATFAQSPRTGARYDLRALLKYRLEHQPR